jgi:hypothetical protein
MNLAVPTRFSSDSLEQRLSDTSSGSSPITLIYVHLASLRTYNFNHKSKLLLSPQFLQIYSNPVSK